MVHSSSVTFSICLSFPIVSVGILLNIVLRRGMILYCSVISIFVSLQPSPHSVLSRNRQFRVPTILSVLGKISISFCSPGSRLFRV